MMKRLIDHESFVKLPTSAQALYLHLSSRAEEDGFVNDPEAICRKIGANSSDLGILLDQTFLLRCEDGVLVVGHLRLRESIRSGSERTVVQIRRETRTPIADSAPSPFEERFERFWGAYPKKVGKGAALKSFLRIKPSEDLVIRMITVVEQMKKTDQWKREHGQFIPHPATWLNQSRWEDEVAMPGAGARAGGFGSFDEEEFIQTALKRTFSDFDLSDEI
jgi:hypothetical protein